MKPKIEDLLGKPVHRAATLSVSEGDRDTLEIAFSSEEPVEQWPGVFEILSHDPGACDLSRLNDGANLLFNHDPDMPLGVVKKASIAADKVGRAAVRLSSSPDAAAKRQDVQDGILTKASVGYRILEMVLVQENEDGSVVYRVNKWQPYEISIVTIPADVSVGVGRSMTKNSTTRTMKTETEFTPVLDPAPTEQNQNPPPVISVERERAAARQSEQDRVRTILAAGKQYNLQEVAMEAVENGASVDQARQLFLDAITKRNVQIREASQPIGLNEEEARSFSFVKLLRALSAKPEDRASREAAKFELEACAAAGDRVKHRALKGTMIPVDALHVPLLKRSATGNIISVMSGTGYTGTGANAIQTTLLAGSFIDVLRNKTTIMKLATDMSGLEGNIDIPKKIGKTSGYWIGEDDSAPIDSFNFGIVALSAKTAATQVQITRKMLTQPALSVEALVRSDIAEGVGTTIDLAAYYGTGESNDPIGLANTTGISSINLATAGQPLWSELVQSETDMASLNADIGQISWVVNPTTRGYAKLTRRLPGSTDSTVIWEPGNTINGYPVQVTNQITSGDLFFGNFADFLIGLWGGLEITVDPYTNSDKGRIRIVAMQDVDFAVRRPESFVYSTHTSS